MGGVAWNRKGYRHMKKISITVPCYNEAGNVRKMAETLTSIMKGLPYDYEIVFTDNCSTDGTREILRELAGKDSRIKVLLNSRNYGVDGRSARNTSQYLSGDVMIWIACDFQDPPELIPEFIRCWEEGYMVVCGQKTGSREGKIKYGCRSIFYKLIQMLSDVPQYEHISGIMLYDRKVMLECIKADYDINLRFLLADMGYKVKLIQYEQRERKSGRSSYNIWRYLTFAINSMVVTSSAPLRMMTVLGIIMSAISFLIGIIYLVLKLTSWHNFQAGTAPVLIGMFFLGSVQLLFMGILGEYVSVILRKVTKRPDVILSDKLNFDDIQEKVSNL
uniref:Glycosyltransferase 2-like domain-containing protein n=1 Tax=Eubacterium plexicaudatum ASF492 TaxID=1235802 RepID=N2ARW5_9FIRM